MMEYLVLKEWRCSWIFYSHFQINYHLNEPIWGWFSCWFRILEFAPLKISGLIPSNVNFNGKIHTELYSDFKWDYSNYSILRSNTEFSKNIILWMNWLKFDGIERYLYVVLSMMTCFVLKKWISICVWIYWNIIYKIDTI